MESQLSSPDFYLNISLTKKLMFACKCAHAGGQEGSTGAWEGDLGPQRAPDMQVAWGKCDFPNQLACGRWSLKIEGGALKPFLRLLWSQSNV